MDAAHAEAAQFHALQTMTPNDLAVGFDFVAPEISISTVPTLLVNQPVVLAGSVHDDSGVVRVEVHVNVALVDVAVFAPWPASAEGGTWTLPWVPEFEGEHTLTVLAYDASGNVGRVDVPIAVELAPPVVVGAPYAWMTTFPELRTDHEPAGLAVDGAGDLYQVFTHPALPAQPHDFNVGVVSKHRSDGATYWVRQYEGQFHLAFDAVVGVADGIVVAGSTPGAIEGVVATGVGDAFVMKLDAAGEIVWATRFEADVELYGAGTQYWLQALAGTSDGSVVAVGGTVGGEQRAGCGRRDLLALRAPTVGANLRHH